MRPVETNQIHCTVIGADKLPAEVGGPDAVCRSMREAVSAARSQAAAGELSITVQIISPYSAAATVTMADGRKLVEQQLAISDRKLNQPALAMLAKAVASQLAATR